MAVRRIELRRKTDAEQRELLNRLDASLCNGPAANDPIAKMCLPVSRLMGC